MTVEERKQFARTAIQRVFNANASEAERRAALQALSADIEGYLAALAPKGWAATLLDQYRQEKGQGGEK